MGAEATAAKQHSKRRPNKGGARGPKPKMTKEERRKKYTDIARKRREKQNGMRRGGRQKTSVCYNCRLPGHNASECPSLGKYNTGESGGAVCTPVNGKALSSSTPATILCYKCGSTEHALHNCPKRHWGDRSDLPYATCFICNQKGHLASACPQNTTGIYINGGCCRTCGSTQHLGKDCPEKKKKNRRDKDDDDDDVRNNMDKDLLADVLKVDDNHSSTVSRTKQDTRDKQKKKKSEASSSSSSVEPKKKKRVVNF